MRAARPWRAVVAALGFAAGADGASAGSAAPVYSPVFDIPRLAAVKVDGTAADWGTAGLRVEAFASVDGQVKAPSDLDARLRLGWNEQGLLLLVSLRDDVFVEHDSAESLWQNDCLEVWLADRRGGTQLVQMVVAAGMDGKHAAPRLRPYDHRKDAELKKTAPTATVARTAMDGGCVLELLVPWTNIGLAPKAGDEVGFQFYVDDSDAPSRRPVNLVWYPGVAPFVDAQCLHRLRLAEQAGAPVTVAGRAFYDGVSALRGVVAGGLDLAGQAVALRVDGVVVAEAVLEASAGQAVARLRAPVPPPGASARLAEVLVDGRVVDTLALPDLTAVRVKAQGRASFMFRPFCFDGEQFPEAEFENPLAAENAFGPYSVHVTWYDAACQPVTRAAQPGRYGAVVEIRPRQGDPVTRCYTLFRMPQKMDWRGTRVPVTVTLPDALGISSTVVQEQTNAVADFMKDRLVESLERSPDSASFLAWLYETAPGVRATDRTGPSGRNQRYLHEVQRAAGRLAPLPYLVHVPEALQREPGVKRPAILFLHGSGERGLSLEGMARQSIVTYAKAHPDYPFILIAPVCPRDQWWQAPALEDLVAEVKAKYPIDPERFYLTGLSMGGFGSWMLAIEHPDWFAAVAPICGGGDPEDVERIKDVPVWNFHGAKDPTVVIRRSDEMVEALRKQGGRVLYTVYSDGGHGIWGETYNREDLYAWLLRQLRGKPAQAPATEQGKTPTEERPMAKP